MSNKSNVQSKDIKKKSITFQTTSRMRTRYPFYNPTSLIPSECEVDFIPKDKDGKPDPESAYTRVARYLPGMKSIWEDEWSELDVKKRGRKIKLTYGFIDVKTNDRNLLEYLRVAAYNEANGDTNINSSVLYREIDHEFDAEKAIKKERVLDAAKSFVLNGDINEVRAIALALAQTKGQMDSIHSMDEFTLRNSLRGAAQTNPDAFVGQLKDGKAKNKVAIIKALQKGVIKVDDVEGVISWGSNDQIIIEAIPGMEPIEYFAELSVDNEEYRNLLDNVKELSKSKDVKAKVEAAPELEWYEKLAKDSIDKGILIEKNASWFVIPGKTEDDEVLFKAQGKKKLYAAIQANKNNVIALLSGGK